MSVLLILSESYLTADCSAVRLVEFTLGILYVPHSYNTYLLV